MSFGDDYDHLSITTEGRAVWVTIDNPPINLITRELLVDLLRFSERAAADPNSTVVVIQSANPDFFIAHFDVTLLQREPGEAPPRPTKLNAFDEMIERFRTMPKATICKIAGRVGGGGSELAMGCDMRFAALGCAVMNQMEVPIGIIPGGGGTQRLPGLVGHNRAAELILGGLDLDAVTGEAWGYFNRALPPEDLDAYVDGLARRVASFDPDAVRGAKHSLLRAHVDPTDGLIDETHIFNTLQASDSAQQLLQRFLELGGQTPASELRMEDLAAEIAES
ncbi:MAG: enoyl-CoA hydratase/isomerase family protein [Acidimicrobiales bacterium]|nr:enoyl-CoA hydratase/isomerase family protein [Acidimicrobiales bacterium]